MDTTLTVAGMHCDACKSLIRLELEDNGFQDRIESLELVENQNHGTLRLHDVSTSDIDRITTIINALDQYSVA